MHKAARKAAAASMAAANQKKYLEFSKAMYKNYNQLSEEKIRVLAEQTGLDMEQFDADIKAGYIQTKINKDVQLAKKLQVRGVPAIFINGKALKNRSLDGMSQIIEAEIKKIK